jgi:hypothetical protein
MDVKLLKYCGAILYQSMTQSHTITLLAAKLLWSVIE